MRRSLVLTFWAAVTVRPCLVEAAGNLRVLATTPTQAILAFEKPEGGTVTIEVSESSSFATSVHDVDETLYPGSSRDTTRPSCIATDSSVTCAIGKRTVETAADGKVYSRALRASTAHYFRVTWPDASQETVTASTKDPILGGLPHDAWQMDPANKGKVLWPTPPYTDRAFEIIEPSTGVTLKPFGLPSDVKAQFFQDGDHALANCWQGSNWTLGSPCGALNASGATYSETTRDFLALGIESISADGSGGWRGDFMTDRWGTNPMVPRWLRFRADLWFTGADLAPADREVEICWGRDDLGCTSPPVTVVAGTSPSATVVCNGLGTAACTDGEFWGTAMPEAAVSRWSAGKVYNTGPSTVVNFTDAGDCKRLKPGMGLFVNTGGGISQIAVSSTDCGAAPPAVVVAGPVDLRPPVPGPSQGWPFFHQAGLVRNTSFSFLVRKKSTTANNTLHVANAKYGIGAGGRAAGSSTGEYTVCSGEEKLSSAGFMHCIDAIGKTYAIHPVTGEVRFLGTAVANTSGAGRAALGTLPVLWEDANHWWASAGVPGGGTSIFLVSLGAAAQNDDASAYISVDGGNEAWYDAAVTNMLGTSKIGDLIQAFDSTFNKDIFPSCSVTSYNVSRYLIGVCRLGNQDTYSWLWVYDLGNKQPLGSGGNGAIVAAFPTYSSATKVGWGVVHASHVTLDTSWVAVQNTIAKEDTTGNQKFFATFDSWFNGTAWSATALPQQPSVRIRLTSAWNGAWGAPPPAFQSGDPVSATQSPHWLQKLAVGNHLWLDLGAEHMEITAINGQDANGLDITVTRKACPGENYATSPSPGTPIMVNLRCNTLDFWWDWRSGPHGEDSSIRKLDLPGGGHQVDTRFYNIGTPEVGWHACDIETDPSCFPMDSTNRTQVLQRSQPAFGGKTAPVFGSCHEGHPGFYPEPGGGLQRATDIHPFICGYTAYTVTWIEGDLFRLTNPSGFPLNRKHYVTMVSMGAGLTGKDISGPASLIDGSNSHAYDFCVVLLPGECRPGSAPGEIYVNHPGFGSKSVMCQDSSITPDDLCVEDTAGQAQAVGMYILTGLNGKQENIARYKGREWMSLVQTVNLYQGKGHANTSNVKMLSLNWGWFNNYLVKLPRSWTLDDVNRSSFSRVTADVEIGSAPPGTDNVYIEFGYDELNGAGLAFPPCTTRQETCVASQTQIPDANPFFWASETFPGLPCAGGCKVSIPGISGRVVYYRIVYRSSSGQVLAKGPVQMQAVP